MGLDDGGEGEMNARKGPSCTLNGSFLGTGRAVDVLCVEIGDWCWAGLGRERNSVLSAVIGTRKT